MSTYSDNDSNEWIEVLPRPVTTKADRKQKKLDNEQNTIEFNATMKKYFDDIKPLPKVAKDKPMKNISTIIESSAVNDDEDKVKIKTIDRQRKLMLQQLRTVKGLTRKQLAAKVFVPEKIINEYENGTCNFNAEFYSKLLSVLKDCPDRT